MCEQAYNNMCPLPLNPYSAPIPNVARAPALVRQLRPLVVQIPQALPDLYIIT